MSGASVVVVELVVVGASVVVAGASVVVGAADVVGESPVSVDSPLPPASLVTGASVVDGASAASSSAPPHADANTARAVIETSNRVIRFISILPSGGVDTVQITDTNPVDSFIES